MKIEIKNKRKIYIFLSIVLWMLLSFITYILIERSYINNLLAQNILPVSFDGGFFLPRSIVVVFLIFGASLGYFIGTRWWQLVYVERRHWRFKK